MDQLESLCTLLGEEARVCTELARVLREEQHAVVALRAEAIFACLEQREALRDQLTSLATRRRELVQRIGDGRSGAGDRVSALLPLLPIERQSRVRDGMRTLRRALLEARSLERQNALLIGGSLDGVNDLLRTLRSLIPGARYGRDAQVAGPGFVESLDRRA